MSHQDWKPVVINKGASTKKVINSDENVTKRTIWNNTQVPNSKKIEENAKDGDLTIPKICPTLKLEIQKARTAKKLTQKQLAFECQMPEQTIKNYENGKGIPNPQELVKIGKVLGITLRNK